MKICLTCFYFRYNQYPSKYTLGVMRLAEYLMGKGYEVDIKPINLDKFDEEKGKYLEELQNKQYDIVGFSTFTWNVKQVNELSKEIQKSVPNTAVVIGGPETKILNENDWTNEIFILGEGETALHNICRFGEGELSADELFEQSPNVFTKNSRPPELIESEIAVSTPLFTNLKLNENKFLWYETSRGCAYSCGYCGHKTRKHIEMIDEETIKQEIINIGKLNYKECFVVDPNLGGIPSRGKTILKFFNDYAPNTKLYIYLRPEFIDDEFIKLLKNANLKEVRIGIQTTNEDVPKWIRSNSMKHVVEQLPKLSKNNINWLAELIVGLPYDNFEGLKNSIDFVENVLKPTKYDCYRLTAIQGTRVYDYVDAFDKPAWIKINENSAVEESSTFSKKELQEMLKYAQEKKELYNNGKVSEKS